MPANPPAPEPAPDDIAAIKRALRARARAQRRATPEAERRRDGLALAAALASADVLLGARTVALYVPFDGELDPNLLLDQPGAADLLPVWPRAHRADHSLTFHRHDAPQGAPPQGAEGHAAARIASMAPGAWNIPEPAGAPVEPDAIDLIVVPGVLFGEGGERLGMGSGFYDRLLQRCTARTLALAWPWQLVEGLPTEAHDRRIELILTPGRRVPPARADVQPRGDALSSPYTPPKLRR